MDQDNSNLRVRNVTDIPMIDVRASTILLMFHNLGKLRESMGINIHDSAEHPKVIVIGEPIDHIGLIGARSSYGKSIHLHQMGIIAHMMENPTQKIAVPLPIAEMSERVMEQRLTSNFKVEQFKDFTETSRQQRRKQERINKKRRK